MIPEPSRRPSRDPIDAWIQEHPWRDGSQDPGSRHAERVTAILQGRAVGSYCVNRELFDQLRALEGRRTAFDPVAPAATWSPEVRKLRRRIARTLDAWRLAERDHAAGRRGSPAFAILDLEAVTVRGDRRKPSRRKHLTDEQRAKQRHRYKGAVAANLERFARPHLVRDPRHPLYRPRWLDHVAGCRGGRGEGRRCSPSCGRIPLPPLPRRRGRARKRDHLTVPEWLLDRAAAARGCQDVVGLQDRHCSGIVVVPQSCHVRTCPDCEAARQTRTVKRYQAAVELLDPARTGFLTLTVKSPERDYLAEGITHLTESAEKLRRRAIWKGGRCRDRKRCRQPWDPAKRGWRIPHEPVTASLNSIEHTHNAAGFHPHLHAIVEGRIDQAELADTWEAITGDSRVVWIESVHRHAAERNAGDVQASLRELLKYSAKPSPAFLSEKDPAVVAELLVALRGRRLTSSTGRLFGLGLDEDPEEADRVLVWPEEGDEARPYHAPRLCPHHDGEASWRVLVGHQLRRRDCIRAPDRSRPGRSILTHPPPPA